MNELCDLRFWYTCFKVIEWNGDIFAVFFDSPLKYCLDKGTRLWKRLLEWSCDRSNKHLQWMKSIIHISSYGRFLARIARSPFVWRLFVVSGTGEQIISDGPEMTLAEDSYLACSDTRFLYPHRERVLRRLFYQHENDQRCNTHVSRRHSHIMNPIWHSQAKMKTPTCLLEFQFPNNKYSNVILLAHTSLSCSLNAGVKASFKVASPFISHFKNVFESSIIRKSSASKFSVKYAVERWSIKSFTLTLSCSLLFTPWRDQ